VATAEWNYADFWGIAGKFSQQQQSSSKEQETFSKEQQAFSTEPLP
jgi:hypothetical protein